MSAHTRPYGSPPIDRYPSPSGSLAARAPGAPATVALPQLGRPAVLALLTVAAVLLVVFLLVRRAVLRHGGWRRSWRRLRSEVSLIGLAFTEPFRALSRYRQGVYALTECLTDPATLALAERALDAATGVLGDVLGGSPGPYPYAVRLGPEEVTVEVAGRRLPLPLAPWRTDRTVPGHWRITYDDLYDVPADPRHGPGRGRRRLVAVGVHAEDCVFLDLSAGPGLVSVEGDGTAGRGLLQALAAQLDGLGSGGDWTVTVTRGVHPQHQGPELDEVLDALERSGGEGAVVVGIGPAQEQVRRLGVLAEEDGALCVVQGRVAGPRWTLRVDHRNRVVAPELDLLADCAPLPRSVARALRAARPKRGGEAAGYPPSHAQPVPSEDDGVAWAPGAPTGHGATGVPRSAQSRPHGAQHPGPDGGAGTWYGEQPGDYDASAYGEQPWDHGDPAPASGEQPTEYDDPAPGHGQHPAGYGEPAPGYGEYPPSYGEPAPASGKQAAAYGEPASAYGEHPAAYGEHPAAYGEQPRGHGEPATAYGEQPAWDYGEPIAEYGQPATEYRERPWDHGEQAGTGQPGPGAQAGDAAATMLPPTEPEPGTPDRAAWAARAASARREGNG